MRNAREHSGSAEPAGFYGYRVKARNANGLSRRSRNLRVDVPEAAALETAVPDVAAQNFQVTGQSSTTIALDWDPPDGIDPNHYRVFVFESGDGPVDDRFETEIATTASRRTVDRLQPDTTYEIYLFPVTDQGVKLDILSLTHSTEYVLTAALVCEVNRPEFRGGSVP
ncbi:fibronectin type III domain-containing protein [Candidatus Poriferisodalis sp.]|uniref:fibronectin type III domain-containing protein n=1 Tax=Candidatus Poriferisodalis sp. TaxID=3101277 RepID=UPI003B52B85E